MKLRRWVWLVFCAAIALHVIDEALTGFLAVYNPTVMVLRGRWVWFPMPVFRFETWLSGLVAGVLLLLLLTPLATRAPRWFRIPARVLSVLMMLNACGHILFTVLGRTVAEVTFRRPAPGFWSSLLLLPVSVWLFRRLGHAPSLPLLP